MTDISSFLDTKLLILVPTLLVIGQMIKSTEKIDNQFIPLLLGGISVLLAFCFEFVGIQPSNFHTMVEVIFLSVTQGVIAAGLAVYGNQIYKQINGK